MQGQLTSNGPSAAEGGVDLALLVQTVLAERFHRAVEDIKQDTRLVADLGLDSLDMIEINIDFMKPGGRLTITRGSRPAAQSSMRANKTSR